jgi:hypothetical protein
MRKRLGGLGGRKLGKGVTAMILSGVVMAVTLRIWIPLGSRMPVILHAFAGIAVGALTYWGVALVLRVEESKSLPGMFLARRKAR